MRKMKLLLMVLSFVATFSFAQSSDELEIRQLERHWMELLDKGDTAALLKIWSEDYVVNNPYGRIVTPKDIMALMERGHRFPAVKRNIENITFNQNIAVVMGEELQQPANMTVNQEEWTPRRFTNIWIKSESGWQLAARQSSVVVAI